MFIHADTKYGIDFVNSWLIGDKESDIEAANKAGITNTILVRSGHNINEAISNSRFIINSIKDASQVIKK
jgi:D-glycero-D-manno-heptose 1,7-bisphosphate phosphatase